MLGQARFSRALNLALLCLSGCGGGCAEDPADAVSPETEPVEAPVTPKITTTPAGDFLAVTVHRADQLDGIDLAEVEHLDLAFSGVDQVGHLADGNSASACRGLDLLAVATAATKLRSLRVSGCPDAVHGGLGGFGPTLEILELADMVLDGVTIGRISQLSGLRELLLYRVTAGTDTLRPLSRMPLETIVLADLERDSELSGMLDLWPRTLQEVQLHGSWASHKAMLTLARAEALRRLELRDTRITNFSFHQVKTLPYLEEVVLSGRTFTDGTPLYLQQMPLRRFTCDCPRFGDGGLKALKRSEKLRVLELPSSSITGEGLQWLSDYATLEELVIEGGDIGANGLSALGGVGNLRRLELSGEMSAIGMPGLGDLAGLEVLRLGYAELDDRIGSELSKLENLRELDLRGTKFSDAGLAALADLTELRVLKLSGTRVTNRGLEHLSNLAKLEVLELDHTDVVDGGVAHLASLANLRELRLGHTLITDAGLQHLLALRSLERLDLAHTVVTPTGVAKLTALPRLTTVGLEGTRATEDDG